MNDLDSLPLTPPLTIAVVYQDSLTQRWTAELCARAKVQCGQGTMQCAHWRLDTLSDPAVFKRAVAFALQANLLVIAAYAHMNLPSDVKRWVQTGSQQGRAHKGALVALLGKCSFAREPLPAKEYLNATAEATGVPYFLREFTLPTELPELTMESIDQRAHTTTLLLSEMLRRTEVAHAVH